MPPPGFTSVLNTVTALSKTDVWAVGVVDNQGLALHFDGTSWSVVSTPTDTKELWGVDAVSSQDVWAVGWGGGNGALAIHWDGTVWSEVPTSDPGPYGGLLYDVAALAPDDVWAVGQANGPSEGESSTLTEHWNGTAWSIVPSPSPFSGSHFLRMSADSPSDVWAVGLAEVDRWDGSAWNLVASVPDSWKRFFLDIAAFAPGDVWVTGYSLYPQTQPAFTHWNGTAWEITKGPSIPEWGQMFGIGGPSTDRLWAVGKQSAGTLMERWNGTSWRVVQTPTPPAELNDVVVDSDGVGWAVGSTTGWGGDAFAEHTCGV